ncbi:hypothetical protein THRCLA_06839 [Thraustotheca clavata]|uniref:GYF domain-containing protein n=1 Tax=Thraustotheca clavata TaxID=74557 RepID=A0A1V9ZIL0_9STRA|nr:hypothetical protein THRCLA_06839 [Thraustotheca clavata]
MKRHGGPSDEKNAKKSKRVQFNAKKHVRGIEETKGHAESDEDDDDDDEEINNVVEDEDDDEDDAKYESGDSDAEETKKPDPPVQHRVYKWEKKARADMPSFEEEGVRIMPFNLEEDREDGHFDNSGNFVWAKTEKAVQEDAWLDNVSAEDMEIAERAQILKSEKDDDEVETWTERRAKSVFMEILNEEETVLKALQRLGKKSKHKAGKKKNATSENEQTPEMKREFNQLTDAADFMLRQGHTDIYHKPKEEIVDKPEPKSTTFWEYRTSEGQIHGPYPTDTIMQWRNMGYFQGESAVKMRQCASESSGAMKLSASAAQDLENDFDDDDEEETKENEGWILSDAINFRQYV